MTPLLLVSYIALGFSAFAWIASLFSGDTSWVDRCWSLVPWVYTWVFASYAHLHNARLDAMAILTTLWGLRLTYNFARKGGYSGVEDYRWAILRSRMSKVQFQLFNFFFIVLYQNFLLVLITLPAYTAYQHRSAGFNGADIALAALFLIFLAFETVADQQQWNFHQWKKAEVAAGRTPNPQFLQSGLFGYSRHPNYFFELAQWWTIFFFGVSAAHSLWQWTAIGPVLLSVLFVGSTKFTEEISISKYQDYEHYRDRVSRTIPTPRRPWVHIR